MSIDRMLQIARQETLRTLRDLAPTRVGRVTSYDPALHRVKCVLLPEADAPQPGRSPDTDWMPVSSPFIGNGWGMSGGVGIGDQVVITHVHGSYGAPVVVGRIYDTRNPAPASPSGELTIRHESGAYIRFGNDGKIHMGGGDLVMDDHDIHVAQGDVYDQHGSLDRLRGHYNVHDHQHGVGTTTHPDPE